MQWINHFFASFIAINDEHSLGKGKKQGELSSLKMTPNSYPRYYSYGGIVVMKIIGAV